MSNINNTSNLLKAAANSLKHTNVFLRRPKPILLYISRIIHHALMQPLSTNEAKCLHKSTYLVVYQKILFKLNTKNLYSFDVLTL